MSENSGTDTSDDRITDSKRTKYTDATKRANVNGLNKAALGYLKNDEERKKKAHDYYETIAALEAEEASLLRDLRAIRGQLEEEKRKLEKRR